MLTSNRYLLTGNMTDQCTVKFALKDQYGHVKIFTADFPKWNLPCIGDHVLVNNNNGQVIFTITGKTHVFENGVFKEILFAVSQYDSDE